MRRLLWPSLAVLLVTLIALVVSGTPLWLAVPVSVLSGAGIAGVLAWRQHVRHRGDALSGALTRRNA